MELYTSCFVKMYKRKNTVPSQCVYIFHKNHICSKSGKKPLEEQTIKNKSKTSTKTLRTLKTEHFKEL